MKILKETIGPEVHDQLVREAGFLEKWIEPLVVGYLERDMCIAPQNGGDTHIRIYTSREGSLTELSVKQ